MCLGHTDYFISFSSITFWNPSGTVWPGARCSTYKPAASITLESRNVASKVSKDYPVPQSVKTAACNLEISSIGATYTCITYKQQCRFGALRTLQRPKSTFSRVNLTFSGSWDSTSFFSLRRRNGRSTLCRRRMIKMVSSSFKSTWTRQKEWETTPRSCLFHAEWRDSYLPTCCFTLNRHSTQK